MRRATWMASVAFAGIDFRSLWLPRPRGAALGATCPAVTGSVGGRRQWPGERGQGSGEPLALLDQGTVLVLTRALSSPLVFPAVSNAPQSSALLAVTVIASMWKTPGPALRRPLYRRGLDFRCQSA